MRKPRASIEKMAMSAALIVVPVTSPSIASSAMPFLPAPTISQSAMRSARPCVRWISPRRSGSGMLAPSRIRPESAMLSLPVADDHRGAAGHDDARHPGDTDDGCVWRQIQRAGAIKAGRQMQHRACGRGLVDGALQCLRLIVRRVRPQPERGGVDRRSCGDVARQRRCRSAGRGGAGEGGKQAAAVEAHRKFPLSAAQRLSHGVPLNRFSAAHATFSR